MFNKTWKYRVDAKPETFGVMSVRSAGVLMLFGLGSIVINKTNKVVPYLTTEVTLTPFKLFQSLFFLVYA